jgi:folate-binding protein YgfZ
MTDAAPWESPLRDRHRRFALEESERMPVLAAEERGGAATGHRRAFEPEYLPYAAPDATVESGPACELIASFGPIEPEYAAIRRGAALFDATFRGTLVVTGADRRDYLQRMVTQDLKRLDPTTAGGSLVRSFWLNRKGRIDADLVIAELGDRMIIDLDRTRAAHAAQSLGSFLFSEDVRLEDRSASMHRLELHGPAAARTLALAGAKSIPAADEARHTEIAGIPVELLRNDALGEHGWSIVLERDRVADLWDALLAVRDPHAERHRVRPIGWNAYNIARVEAGTPLFHIDFGTSNLPHETGVLRDRVSFRKGCYLGQEIVARMESLGKPKQTLVGLRPTSDLLPVAGAQVFLPPSGDAGSIGDQVGTVTSSTLAPMLGAVPIAFAMIRTASAAIGATLLVNAEGAQCEAVVTELRAWPPAAERAAASTQP